jgi:hypothetical protein
MCVNRERVALSPTPDKILKIERERERGRNAARYDDIARAGSLWYPTARMSAHLPARACCFAALLWLLSGCGGDNRLRSEARAFLTLYESLDHREKPAVRELKLRSLAALVLTEPLVKQARDACMAAHKALLTSEREHEEAARKLDQAIADNTSGAPLPVQATEQIRQGIDQADRSLSAARGLFQRCESQARSLSLRFGKS